MTLNEKALFDLMYCPLFFHTKYELGIAMQRKNNVNDCIKQTLLFFYAALLNGQLKTYKQLQAKWDALADVAHLEPKQRVTGWEKIVRIIEWSKQKNLVIGDVNCQYTYSSASHTIEGNIDFIAVTPNKDIELLYFDLSDRQLSELDEPIKLKYALDYFGFLNLYGQKPSRLKIYQPKRDHTIVMQLNTNDESRLKSIIANACQCIEQKLYVPREGYTCVQCIAKNYCRYFGDTTYHRK